LVLSANRYIGTALARPWCDFSVPDAFCSFLEEVQKRNCIVVFCADFDPFNLGLVKNTSFVRIQNLDTL
jgi:hypothetical protein